MLGLLSTKKIKQKNIAKKDYRQKLAKYNDVAACYFNKHNIILIFF